jgi:hypothetical protein
MIARMTSRTVQVAVMSLAAGTLLGAQPQMTDPWTARINALPTPAAADSGQPQLSSSARGVILSWVERRGPAATLRFAERTADGWSAPRDVATGTDWFVNWADVPSVIRLGNGALAAHWLQKSGADTYAYDVRLAYSQDEGKTWSASFTPHSDGTSTEHGFASLFQLPGAGLGLAWLDGRAMKADPHDAHGAGAMSVRFAAYGTDWKRSTETPIDLRVCECCPTAAAVTADGPIVAYRNRADDETRDIYVSRLENGAWSAPKAVHDDGWKINACPVNGPMLSARGKDVAIAWFTARDDQPRTFVAFSRDSGRTFAAPIRLDDAGSLGRVDIDLLPDGSAVASWIELADEGAQLRMRRVQPSGARSPAVPVSALAASRASGYPRLAVHNGEVVFAWTEAGDGGPRVKTAVSPLTGRNSSQH